MSGARRAQLGRSLRCHAPALALFTALTVVVLWPAFRHFTTRPLIGAGDSSIFYWAWWWLPEAIGRGVDPLRTDQIMFPVGVDLRVTVLAPAVALLTWPVRALLGPEAQVNTAQILATWTAAVAAYALAHRLWRHRGAAAVAGAAYACTPYRFVHLGEHLNLIYIGLLPLALLLWLRAADVPSTRRFALLGAVLGITVLFEPQLAAISGLALLPFLIVQRRLLREHLAPSAAGLGVAVLCAAPVAVPLVGGLVAGETTPPQTAEEITATSSSPFSWVVPPRTNPLLGGLADIRPLRSGTEGVTYPGLVLIGLAIAGRRWDPDRRRTWHWLAGLGVVLSLGPFLVVGEEFLPLPLPYHLVRELPFMDTMRAPGRFGLMGVLAVIMLAAGTLAELCRRHPRRSGALLAGVAFVAAVELLPGEQPQRVGGAPAPYTAIARDPGDGAVLEIPMQWSTGVEVIGDTSNDLHVALFMAWATEHGKPYVGGAVSRYPQHRLEDLMAIPVYREILSAQQEPGFDEVLSFTSADLAGVGIGFVVYHRDAPEPTLYDHLESLALPVLADDGTVIVWRVPSG